MNFYVDSAQGHDDFPYSISPSPYEGEGDMRGGVTELVIESGSPAQPVTDGEEHQATKPYDCI